MLRVCTAVLWLLARQASSSSDGTVHGIADGRRAVPHCHMARDAECMAECVADGAIAHNDCSALLSTNFAINIQEQTFLLFANKVFLLQKGNKPLVFCLQT